MQRPVLTLGGAQGIVDRLVVASALQAELFEEEVYSLVMGLRTEWDSLFGLVLAPRLAGMYQWSGAWRVLVGAGLGYRAPDFNDLYLLSNPAPAMPYVISGNPDLHPEYSLGGNLALEYSTGLGYFQVNGYFTELFSEIVFADTGVMDEDSGKLIYRTENLERSMRAGVDLEGRWNIYGPFFVSLGYGGLFAYNRITESPIYDQPGHTFRSRLGANGRQNPWHVHVSLLFFSALEFGAVGDGGENRLQLNFYGAYPLGKNWEINIGVENLLGYINPSLGPFLGPLLRLGTRYTF